MRKIITLSREFGSGGREIGKRLADYLGISYFDSEIVEELSKQTKLNKNYLDDKFEKGISHYSISFGSSFSRISNASNSAMLLAKQHNVIKKNCSRKRLYYYWSRCRCCAFSTNAF